MEVKKQSAVRLLKNNIYLTYQLYAEMANDKTPAEKGLVFAALTVLDWLKKYMF